MNAFSRTLVNPVAEFRGATGNYIDIRGTLVVCQVKQGSTIYSLANAGSEPLLMLEREQSWEALYQQSDTEWLNVVVPGHGLGWVQAYDIIVQNEELLAANSKIGLALDWFEVPLVTRALGILMRSIGHRLSSLDLIRPPGQNLDAIYYYCTSLEHLSLTNNNLRSIHLRELLGFLQSGLAQRLTSLNLSNTGLEDGDVGQLLEVLKAPGCLPLLRELRLKHMKLTVDHLASLSDIFRVKKTLVLLELDKSCSNEARVPLDAEFHNEQVYVPSLPLSSCAEFWVGVVASVYQTKTELSH